MELYNMLPIPLEEKQWVWDKGSNSCSLGLECQVWVQVTPMMGPCPSHQPFTQIYGNGFVSVSSFANDLHSDPLGALCKLLEWWGQGQREMTAQGPDSGNDVIPLILSRDPSWAPVWQVLCWGITDELTLIQSLCWGAYIQWNNLCESNVPFGWLVDWCFFSSPWT